MSGMPPYYRGVLRLPFYWQDEVSGKLRSAVEAYLDNRIKGTAVREEEIDILRDYFQHYINAPCWDNPEFESELRDLRESAKDLDGVLKISAWIGKCLEIGLDPL